MNEQVFDCLKSERDIRIKAKLRDGKTAFRQNPTLTTLNPLCRLADGSLTIVFGKLLDTNDCERMVLFSYIIIQMTHEIFMGLPAQ